VIRRSENGPRCTHCGQVNPAALIEPTISELECIHCKLKFTFWIEKLPFYCSDDGRPPRCDCAVCSGKVVPTVEIEPAVEAQS
jgi:hypothetical protein